MLLTVGFTGNLDMKYNEIGDFVGVVFIVKEF